MPTHGRCCPVQLSRTLCRTNTRVRNEAFPKVKRRHANNWFNLQNVRQWVDNFGLFCAVNLEHVHVQRRDGVRDLLHACTNGCGRHRRLRRNYLTAPGAAKIVCARAAPNALPNERRSAGFSGASMGGRVKIGQTMTLRKIAKQSAIFGVTAKHSFNKATNENKGNGTQIHNANGVCRYFGPTHVF